MYATTEGTTRYIHRFPRYRDAAFCRTIRLPERAAVQFTRFTFRPHVPENLGVAHVVVVPRSLDSVLPHTRSLTVAALIGAPAVREGLHQPYLRLYQ